MEVREYRKRLSLNGTGGGRSPPSAAALSQSRHYPSNPYDIQFAFPKFGDLPGSNFMSNGSLTKVGAPNGTAQRPTSSVNPRILRTQSSSSANAESPMTTNGSFKIGSPDEQFYPSPTNSANDVEDLKVLFSPSILEYASQAVSSDYMTARNTRQPPYPENGVLTNSATPFNTSPSLSSISNKGLDSSCGTTPEPSADSPDNRKGSEGNVRNARRESADQKKSERTSAIAEKASKAQYDFGSTPLTFTNSTVYDINGIDWMAQQNGGQFDPVLFGDYRDPHENILSGFDSDLFNDTFNDRDFDTPFYTEDSTSSTIRPDLMKENRVLPNGTNGETASSHMSKNFLCEHFMLVYTIFLIEGLEPLTLVYL